MIQYGKSANKQTKRRPSRYTALDLPALSSSALLLRYKRGQGGRSGQSTANVALRRVLGPPRRVVASSLRLSAAFPPPRLGLQPVFFLFARVRILGVGEFDLQRVGGRRMVLLQLRHESAVGTHDRALRSDGGEGFAGRHLRRGDEVGDDDGGAPADAHEAVDLETDRVL